MKRLLIFIMLITMSFSAVLVAQQKGPRALVVQPSFDMGYLPLKATVTMTYWINNIGTDSLKIFKVSLSCGCTRAPMQKATIAVNDSVEMELTFDAGPRTKTQNKIAHVKCNDPANSSFELAFNCYIYEPGEPTGPISVIKNESLKLTTKDLGKSFPVVFKNVSKENLTAKLVAFPADLFTVDLPESPIRPGSTGEFIVRTKTGINTKNFIRSFTFELSDPAKTRFTIPVRLAEPISDLRPYEKRGL